MYTLGQAACHMQAAIAAPPESSCRLLTTVAAAVSCLSNVCACSLAGLALRDVLVGFVHVELQSARTEYDHMSVA